MELEKLRAEMIEKKNKVKLQNPKMDSFTDTTLQKKISNNIALYQDSLYEGQKISEKSLLTRFTK